MANKNVEIVIPINDSDEGLIDDTKETNNEKVIECKMKTQSSDLSTNFKCRICFKTFKHRRTLTAHENAHSQVEDGFTCQFCYKTFKFKKNLNAHEKIHSQGQNFACEVCNKSFTEKRSLIRHKKAHLQVKKFTCQMCSKTFRQNYNLSAHEKAQHKSCNRCDYKTLSNKESIDEHIRYKHFDKER